MVFRSPRVFRGSFGIQIGCHLVLWACIVPALTPDSSYPCSRCGRVCQSRIGLVNHQRAAPDMDNALNLRLRSQAKHAVTRQRQCARSASRRLRTKSKSEEVFSWYLLSLLAGYIYCLCQVSLVNNDLGWKRSQQLLKVARLTREDNSAASCEH